ARARAGLGLPLGPLVVCVGRLSRQKAQDVLLDAWPSVRSAVPGATVALVGDGPEEPALRARGLPGVLFAGWRDDVAEWLAAADVVAIPSRWEGLPLVVLEAMARGRSVVSADADGMAESLGADAGAIVPREDPPALAAALVERLLDPARASEEARSGRRRVEREFDLATAGQAMAEVYAEVLQAAGRGRGRLQPEPAGE
ncbi:MAG: glycosyltransferase family 4 protein, partial [Actinomycetota bacterium]|nr:glycosyltransferase family 4 protein [Actinomycetota bacterium]